MARVVDTDVFSFLFKDDTRAALYRQHTDNQFVIVSFMTIAELEQWSLRANWGLTQKSKLNKFLRRYFLQHSTNQICQLWARVVDDGRRSGANIDDADAWIAATELFHNVPLVTHNAGDFQQVQHLTIISEK